MITVVGSNIWDMFMKPEKLPEADQAVHLDSHEEAPGGKGANQAVACAKAGAKVHFFGAIGNDGNGQKMSQNFTNQGIDIAGLKVLDDAMSGVAVIMVDGTDGTHRVIVSHGANKKVKADWVPDTAMSAGSTLLMQGEIDINETEALCLRAKQNGARTVINLAPVIKLSEAFLKSLDVLIVNEHEADALGKDIGITTTDKKSFATEIFNRHAVSTIVTLGGDGAIYCDGSNIYTVSALKVKPVDTIGAGDAFVGYFCAGVDRGDNIEDALAAASVAGSLACTRTGAQSALPTVEEVAMHKSAVLVTKTAIAPPALAA